MFDDPLYATAFDLQAIRQEWGDLLVARLHGSPRPWVELTLTTEQRAKRDELARAERAEADPDAPGWSPAPCHIGVVDVINQVTIAVLELEAAVRDRLGFGPAARDTGALRSRYLLDGRGTIAEDEEPHGTVHWACVWIEDALGAIREVPELAEHVADEARRLAHLVRTACGQVAAGFLIKAACFVCGGISDDEPEGALTLRLYTATRLIDAYVLCHNPACDPSSAECGSYLRGRPMWTSVELEWLNARLDDAVVHGSRMEAYR